MSEQPTQPTFDFGMDIQKRILSMTLYNTSFLIQAAKYLKPHYFAAEPMQWFCRTILSYYGKYSLPLACEVATEIIRQEPQEKQLSLVHLVREIYGLQVREDRYLKDALKEFVQRNEFVRGWDSIARAYNANNIDQAFERFDETGEKIRTVNFDPPDRSHFFEEYSRRRLRRQADRMQMESNVFPTCVGDLDRAINGGLRRGEVGLLFADAKVGKSIGLIHMGFACARTRSGRVIHFVLEGGRRQAEDRYDSRFAECNYYDLRSDQVTPNVHRILEYEYSKYKGWLVLDGLTDKWDYTVPDLEARMAELEAEGFVADLLIVDYADLLEPRKSLERTYEKQDQIYKDLKLLASKAYGGRGVGVWTATQIQRPKRQGKGPHSADTDENFVWGAAEMADSYAKARRVDLSISLNQTLQEKDRGQMRLHLSQARDHVSKVTVRTQCDFTRMIFHTNRMDFVPQLNQRNP